jgi:transcriptional regulator with XRE-family HTH domain
VKKPDEDDLFLNMDAGPGTCSRKLADQSFLREADRRAEAKKALRTADTMKEAVDILRRMKGMSWDQLAVEIGVSRPTLAGWLEAKAIRFQHVVSICVAMRLHGDLGRKLVEISECRTRNVLYRELYWFMIDMAVVLDIDHCNEILALAKLPPLHCGEGCA